MKQRLIVVLGVAGVSLSAVFTRWSTAPALVLALYRMALSAGFMALPALRGGELRRLAGRDVLLCLISGLFLGLHFTAYFAALERTSIAAAVVLVDTEVLFVALASASLLGQRLSRRAWAAVALTFGGSAVVALGDSAGGGALLGDLIALAGAGAMAVYTMIGAVCRRRLSTEVYTFLVYLAAAVSLLAAAGLSATPLTGYGAVNGLTALGMAVCCTLLGHNVFSWGLKYLPAAFISTAKLLEPVLASVWGLLIFNERPGWATILGGAAVVAGIALYVRAPARRQETEMERNAL
jgi:drug/metabolite transporter (DMT)-like permease